MIVMWALAGDIISKIYSGTASVLTAVTLKGHEDLADKLNHKAIVASRWKLQKFSDEFKHECISILRGQHESSFHSRNNLLSSVMKMNGDEEDGNGKKCRLQMASINCHFRLPTDFTNLDKLFGGGDMTPIIDIYCINL